jgi:large subunit ribosomal protein L17
MRNKHKNRILGRTADNRRHLLKNLTSSLLEHGSIVTTEAKAKELRMHVEPLITSAKQEMTLANRRNLLKKLGHKEDLDRLTKVANIHKKRPGGYVRLTRLPITRTDNAPVVRIDIIDAP